jgi:hypothetical protein
MAGSLSLTRLLANQLAGVTATDPVTFASSVALLLAAAILACVIRRVVRAGSIQSRH